MSVADNRALLERAFAGTAKGDGRAFVAMLDDDVHWTIIGTTSWSRTFKGKADVVQQLLAPLTGNFEGANVVSAERFIVEGDFAAVEGRNHSRTKTGDAYANRYCWIFRLKVGKVVEITEYCDTALIERVLAPLPQSTR